MPLGCLRRRGMPGTAFVFPPIDQTTPLPAVTAPKTARIVEMSRPKPKTIHHQYRVWSLEVAGGRTNLHTSTVKSP